MSKIFKREGLQSRGRKLKVDENRKRNIIEKFIGRENGIIRIKQTGLHDSNELKS